jgi:hypothetical protein
MRKRRGVALAVVLLLAALTAGACGSGDNGGVIKGTPAGVTTTTARPGYG